MPNISLDFEWLHWLQWMGPSGEIVNWLVLLMGITELYPHFVIVNELKYSIIYVYNLCNALHYNYACTNYLSTKF